MLAKVLIVPDTHVPYESVEGFGVMLRAAASLNNGAGPDAIVLLGDFFDCYEKSSHEKDLRKRPGLTEELSLAKARLNQLRGLLNTRRTAASRLTWDVEGSARSAAKRLWYIQGNHENRINRAMGREPGSGLLKSYMSAGLLRQQSLLEAMDVPEWAGVDYNDTLVCGWRDSAGTLTFTHDVGRAGQNAHNDAARVYGGTHVAIGHTHRLATATHNVGGRGYTAHMLGWLGDYKQQRYMAQARMSREWSMGFGVGTVGDAFANITAVPIQRQADGQLACCVEGQVVRGA